MKEKKQATPTVRVRRLERRRVAKTFSKPSMTKQSERDGCNVNNIMKKYRATGLITHVKQGAPQYGDFAQIGDYDEALNMVMAAQDAFSELPAHIRKRFDNDPGKYLAFVADDSNREEAIALGMIKKPEEQPKAPPSEAPKGADPK